MSHGPLTALLVEDDPAFLGQLGAAIDELDGHWSKVLLSDGQSAIDHIRSCRTGYAIALVDLGLPGQSGFTVLRELKRTFPHTPALVVSTHHSERDVLDAIRSGAHGYIEKDGDRTDLARSIERVIGGEYPISPRLARYLFRTISADSGTVPKSEPKITDKQKDVLRLLAKGHSYNEAATRMGISINTLQTHVKRLYAALQVHTGPEAVAKAKDHGWI